MKSFNIGGKALGILGAAASAASIALTFITGWIDDKKIDQQISEKVAEEVAKALKGVNK